MIDDIMPPQKPKLQRDKPKRIELMPKPLAAPLHEQARAVEPGFKTPEETAAEAPTPTEPTLVEHDTPSRKWYQWRPTWPPTRKQAIIYSVVAVVLAFGVGAGWTLTHHKRAVVAVTTKKTLKKVAPPVPIYSKLTGLQITDASLNQKPVTAVMIENSLDARPQSGLGDAGVVFEAVAEGGVTRFMAVYQDTAPTNLGPVRSARPYYVSWALGFDAAYGHVGGSEDALNDIKAWGVHDMNQFYNGGYYHRISSRDAPHNVYTGVDVLNQLEAKNGYTSTYTGFTHATKEAPSKQPSPTSISLSLSGPLYDPSYTYNPATNSYDRAENGAPHVDANTNKQLSPKVVIAMVVPLGRGALDASGAYYSDYTTIGTGQAYIFQNGTLTQATWTKSSNNAQIAFTDASGQPIALAPGQAWITAVSSAGGVHYQ